MTSFAATLRLGLVAVFVASAVGFDAFVLAQDNPSSAADTQEETLQFRAFYKLEWRQIIEDYAEQAGLSLQLVDPPPTGTLDYQSDRVMTMAEALDTLNRLLLQNDRVLVRNEDMLLLYDVTKGIPDDMIPTVRASDLENRGKYEVMNCIFDTTGMDGDELRNQLLPFISDHYQRKLTLLPAANVMIVQEVGFKLRDIRGFLTEAAESRNRGNWDARMIELTHTTPEDILQHAAGAMGIDRETLANEDATISLSIAPFANQILATGEPALIDRFERIVKAVDLPVAEDDSAERELPYFQRYGVNGDAEKMFLVLQTMLAGSPDARLEYDADTAQIFLLGVSSDHEKALEIINKMEGSSDELAVLWIKEANVEDIILTVETLFRQDSTSEEVEGPVLTAESQNRLIVRGKPADVAMVRKIVEEVDIPYKTTGPSLPNRFIPASGTELNRSLNLLEGMLPTLGLENKIEVVQPGDRKLYFDYKSRSFEIIGGNRDDASGSEEDSNADDSADEPASADQARWNPGPTLPQGMHAISAPLLPIASWAFLMQPHLTSIGVLMGNRGLQEGAGGQDETNGSGQTSSEIDTSDPQVESVPGAPITIRVTEFGIALESDDLDALDKIERLLLENLDATSGTETVRIYLLDHLNAADAKQLLDSYLGSGGSGGGGGGLGGLMGGLLGNAIGGAGGDMVGDMLGGGGGSSSTEGVFITEAPVIIVANPRNYSLAVSAVPADQELVGELIDFIDQPNAGHNPNPLGESRVIPVRYQDVSEVEAMVKAGLSPIIAGTEQNGQGQPNNDQAEMLRALLGRGGRGGGGGGGGGAEELEAPKAMLVADTKNSQLVVTGPDNLFRLIKEFVEAVDVPTSLTPNDIQIVPRGNIDSMTAVQLLAQQFPDMITIEDESGETTSPSGSGNTGSPSESTPTPGIQMPNADAMRQMMQRAAQQRSNRQNGGGGGRGGGGRRGGGGQGGGGQGGGGDQGGGRGGR